MEDSLLLVIDMQNDFVSPTGSLSVASAMNIIPVINRLRSHFKHVMWTQDWHPSNHVSFVSSHPGHSAGDIIETSLYKQVLFPAHCVQNSEGAKIHPDLDVHQDDLFVVKGCSPEIDSYSCFFDVVKSSQTNASEQIQKLGVKTLYVLGVATDFCVKSSVIDGLSLGYKVFVIEDGIAAVDQSNSQAAIDEMKSKGAIFINSKDILQ
ncbi:bifunctional nicotinamidase/pyrazinamidase [Histomonas meleagridis]|uniref:bifunctional nicotinamidase/pyrazinamidase n=1 Tax=Histomonas meleagridis TaxID=135588 RepID=UPI00355AB6CA|nr:bifunctional nicotinamidase/pyrazinamidase [Histomonas meleagridis]KAH0800051.1 bifunctional nicotinamidase/pyrazinamidase [Histomonas meleagridis]